MDFVCHTESIKPAILCGNRAVSSPGALLWFGYDTLPNEQWMVVAAEEDLVNLGR